MEIRLDGIIDFDHLAVFPNYFIVVLRLQFTQ